MFDIHKMQQRMPDIKQHVTEIMAAGYDPDYISDALTETLTVSTDGRLKGTGDATYGAIIVPAVRFMHPATLKSCYHSLRKEPRSLSPALCPLMCPVSAATTSASTHSGPFCRPLLK